MKAVIHVRDLLQFSVDRLCEVALELLLVGSERRGHVDGKWAELVFHLSDHLLGDVPLHAEYVGRVHYHLADEGFVDSEPRIPRGLRLLLNNLQRQILDVLFSFHAL